MKSVMQHKFSEVPEANIPRSTFNRTHGYKTTFDSGYLVPFYVDEALPGDTFNVNCTLFARLATPIVPFMDNMFMDTFYFAVPIRLVWDNFVKMCGEQKNPNDSVDFLVPQIKAPITTGWLPQSLSDYFGIPTGVPSLECSSLWHRAYNLIWNEWFRDQNLQSSVKVDKGDGPDAEADYVLLKRNKRHDYFTSALPWPQKGPGVELPLGDKAPVIGIGKSTKDFNIYDNQVYETNNPVAVTYPFGQQTACSVAGNTWIIKGDNATTGTPQIYADLSDATAGTINTLRQAFQIQKLYERDARGGTRYTEIVKSHFGTISPDARLQRPEFLGGKSTAIEITPVPQTSPSGTYANTPQGNLASFGTVASNREGFTKSFTEHSLIIGLVMVRADLTYQQGLPRMFSRRTRFDFYWPALAHLGEQAVLNKEIYAVGLAGPTDDEVFGYQERWAEYRYFPSKITGKMRSTDPQTLDVWHLSQKFEDVPTLSSTFIQENPPVDRVIAVQDEPQFVFDSHIECKTVRPMPVYSVPGYIDHF